jgi:transcriptional regulator with XRE-family HTH domain
MTVGQRIKMRRELLEISVSELARKSGLTRQTIYNYENDLREPTLINAMCVADILKITLDYLARGEVIE